MKALPVRLIGFLLTLMISAVAFGQFDNKTTIFTAPGKGDTMREYMFIVPEGTTVTTPEGAMIKGGQTIAVPGSRIKLMSKEEAQKAMAESTPFNNKENMTEEEKASSVMISLDVPEGFTISREDGAMVEGPIDLVLIVKAEAMKMSEPLTNQPSLFHSIGEM
jgi:hypothetical protein